MDFVRPLRAGDLTDLAATIDATGLFPGELLPGMAEPFLSGAAPSERWLSYDDGVPCGVVYCVPERLTDGTWNMLLLAVHPARQGQGIGADLVRRIEREVKSAGARIVLVETSGLPEFEGTRAFYRRCGYEPEARIRDFYRAGDDKVVFRKVL